MVWREEGEEKVDDQIYVLREIAQNLTAKHRRYPDRTMAAGASLLACLLIEYAQRGSAPNPDVVDIYRRSRKNPDDLGHDPG
jgi:hypothetical protein